MDLCTRATTSADEDKLKVIKNMKDFVYLDTSFLHSYLAQLNGGLLSNISRETQESRTETHTDTRNEKDGIGVHGGVRSLITFGVKFDSESGGNESLSLAQLEAGKEIMSLQMHDNAVDDLVIHLKEKKLLIEDPYSIEINKYVLLTSEFKVIDLDYLKKILTKDTLQLLNRVEGVNKGKNKQGNLGGLGDFEKIIDFLSTILPSNLYIKQGPILCPLKNEYLRTQPKEILFKYGNSAKITMLGKVTRELDGPTSLDGFEFSSILSISDMMFGMTDFFMSQFGMGDRGEFIVSPVATFFESI